jgi:hypothetical protein
MAQIERMNQQFVICGTALEVMSALDRPWPRLRFRMRSAALLNEAPQAASHSTRECSMKTLHNAQRTTHNAQRTTHNARLST